MTPAPAGEPEAPFENTPINKPSTTTANCPRWLFSMTLHD